MSRDLDRHWEELLAAGLVGIERRPYSPAAIGGAARPLTHLREADPARAWLAAAGTLTVMRLAGAQPARLSVVEAEPAPAETWPRVGSAAAGRLAQMLAGQASDQCLPEWLATAAARRRRAPEEQLPDLLEWARGRPEVMADLLAVIGERGRWLAAQNERWVYAAHAARPAAEADPSDWPELWEDGSPAERLELLMHVRKVDPAAALTLIRSTWRQDTTDERLRFVKTLSLGLSVADEPFLEEVLRERSWLLRQAAGQLLAQLPESRRCQRLRQMARPLLRLEGGPRGTRKRRASAGPSFTLAVNLPERNPADDREADQPPPPAKETERARWLATILGGVPPMDWCQALNQTPAQLVVLARANVYDFALIEGWATAAAAFGEAEWAEALLRERLPELDTAALEALLRTLPLPRREALVYAALQAVERLAQRQPAVRLLQAYAEPWSPRLTRLFAVKLREELARRDVPFGPLAEFGWLPSAALYWDPGLAGELAPALHAAARQPGVWVNWLSTLERALALWQFRHELHEELAR